MRVRKFNPLLYEKLKDAQGRGYSRALRASSSYTLKKKFWKIPRGNCIYRCSKGGIFCVGGVLKFIFLNNDLLLSTKNIFFQFLSKLIVTSPYEFGSCPKEMLPRIRQACFCLSEKLTVELQAR